MLYTCEMVLEMSRPHLQQLGAFAGRSALPSAAVRGCEVLTTLTAPGAVRARRALNHHQAPHASLQQCRGALGAVQTPGPETRRNPVGILWHTVDWTGLDSADLTWPGLAWPGLF